MTEARMVRAYISSVSERRLFIAFLLLLAGVLIYAFRSDGCPTFLASNIGPGCVLVGLNLPATIANLPDMIHITAWILVSASCLNLRTKPEYIKLCLFWIFLETTFEAAQLIKPFPVASEKIPLLGPQLLQYQNGTFDLNDVALFFVGGMLAYFMLIKLDHKNA